jgi:hypothetical protein
MIHKFCYDITHTISDTKESTCKTEHKVEEQFKTKIKNHYYCFQIIKKIAIAIIIIIIIGK